MELWEVIQRRQSVRKFKEEALGKEDLNSILMAGNMAPVGMAAYGNVHMTVVTNPEVLAAIDQACANKMGKPDAHPLYGAPCMVVLSAKPGKFVIPGIDQANCGCVLENMMLAATEKGVGSVYLLAATEAITENPDVLAKLELPEGFKPIGSLGLGYAAAEMQPRELTFKIEMNSID